MMRADLASNGHRWTSLMELFHHTDLCRLIFILHDGNIRSPIVQAENLPENIVWATTDPNGDFASISSSKFVRKEIRDGNSMQVRIGVSPEGFEPWKTCLSRSTDWTDEKIEKFEAFAREKLKIDTETWWVSPKSVPREKIFSVDAKGWNSDWAPISVEDLETVKLVDESRNDGSVYQMKIRNKVFASKKFLTEEGFENFIGTWKKEAKTPSNVLMKKSSDTAQPGLPSSLFK